MPSHPQTAGLSRAQAWVLAARPKTLPAALAPVVLGASVAVADDVFVLGPALAALLGALLLQIGSNIANDYFDHFKGADQADRLGPTRVTAAGLLPPNEVRTGMIVVFAAAALIGVYLVIVGGWPILAIGVASIAAALAYTGGPKPFGYVGLGDLFVFIFFGPVAVCGTYYVQALTITPALVVASIPVGALITNILVVNNLRDIETDRRAGKMTLAVRLGRSGAAMQFGFLLAVAYVTPVLLWLGGGSAWMFVPYVTLPTAVRLGMAVQHHATTTNFATPAAAQAINAVLAGTARQSLLFALALSIGFLV